MGAEPMLRERMINPQRSENPRIKVRSVRQGIEVIHLDQKKSGIDGIAERGGRARSEKLIYLVSL